VLPCRVRGGFRGENMATPSPETPLRALSAPRNGFLADLAPEIFPLGMVSTAHLPATVT